MIALRPLFVGVVFAAWYFAAAPVNAGIIDTFSATEGGDPDAVSRVTTGSDTVNYVITPTVADPVGSRRQLSTTQNVANQSTSLTVTGGVATISSSTNSVASWSIIYGVGLIPGLVYDATDGGMADAFKLTFDSLSGGLEYALTAISNAGGGTSNGGLYQPLAASLVVPFSSFTGTPNFANLNQIWIQIRDGGSTRGGSAVLTQFEVVPEPGTAALLAAGGAIIAGAALRRRMATR